MAEPGWEPPLWGGGAVGGRAARDKVSFVGLLLQMRYLLQKLSLPQVWYKIKYIKVDRPLGDLFVGDCDAAHPPRPADFQRHRGSVGGEERERRCRKN